MEDKANVGEKNIHQNHRERVKLRFLTEGADNFEQHALLELILFYSVPQKDTNPLAHRLISEFGSISGVFDAPIEELLKVNGVSTHTATLLKLFPAVFRRYCMDKSAPSDRKLPTMKKIGEYLVKRFVGISVETVMLMLMDNDFDLIDCVKIYEGSVNSSALTPRKIVEKAIFKQASIVVLAHNHPNGRAIPSNDDIVTTEIVRQALDAVGVKFMAHVIVAGDTYNNILGEKTVPQKVESLL